MAQLPGIVLPCLALLLLSSSGPAELRAGDDVPITLLTGRADSDKDPRFDGDWVVWTRGSQLVGSDGRVVALDQDVAMLHVLGTGFRPDVTTSASGAVARVAWLAIGLDDSVEVRSSAWDGSDWRPSGVRTGCPTAPGRSSSS